MADQVNPNALGAPAEGFGQTVSFAFDPRGEAPVVNPIVSQPRGGGVSGGATIRGTDPNTAIKAPPRPDPTGALLLKVGEDILSRKLDEQRTAKYIEGMQRAMNDEAITDVVASVPWYAKLFGDTPVIEGARAYTAASTVNNSVAEQAANMPRLAELSGPDAAKHFSKVVTSTLTGDAGTDGVIMKGMAEQLPSLMKAQAKAHYSFNQKRAVAAMTEHVMTAAAALQSFGEMHSNDEVSMQEMAIAREKFVRSIVMPEGMDEDSMIKVLSGTLPAAAIKGQFHAVSALRDSGLMAALPTDVANRLDAVVNAAATKARDNYAFAYSREIAELKSDARKPSSDSTPHSISNRIDAMNAKYMKLTGSPIALFSSDQKADMLAGTFDAFKAEQDRVASYNRTVADANATSLAKEAAQAAKENAVRKMLADGQYTQVDLMDGVSPDLKDRQFLGLVADNPKVKDFHMLQGFSQAGYVNNAIKQQLQAPVRLSMGQPVPTDQWYAAVSNFEKMRSEGGLEYASAYYGDFSKGLQRASTMLSGQGIMHPQAGLVFQAVTGGSQEKRKEPLSPKEAEKFMQEVADLSPSAIVRAFTGTSKLRPETVALMADVAREATENWRGTDLTDKEAVTQGLFEAVHSRQLEIIGGFGIKNSERWKDGQPPPTLKDLASKGGKFVPEGEADSYFQDFMKDHKGIPMDGSLKIYRMNQAAGSVAFKVAYLKDGQSAMYPFTAAEWNAYAQGRITKDTMPKPVGSKGALEFGPSITYPGTVQSPYAHAAAQRKAAIGALFTNNMTEGLSQTKLDAVARAQQQAKEASKQSQP